MATLHVHYEEIDQILGSLAASCPHIVVEGDPQWLMRAASCPCVVEEVILSG